MKESKDLVVFPGVIRGERSGIGSVPTPKGGTFNERGRQAQKRKEREAPQLQSEDDVGTIRDMKHGRHEGAPIHLYC